jgi:hypothetical protein
MTFYIEAIVIYNDRGEKRVLPFKNGINIITGDSGTGKTSIGDIISYCLGGDFTVKGKIREIISWYGLLICFEKQKVFIARKRPPQGQISTNAAYFDVGSNIDIPDSSELSDVESIESIIDYISNSMGISHNKMEPPSWSSLSAARPSLKHALYYCFLKQSTIAHEKTLFHRQDEEFVGKYIRLTAPYFIGAVPEDQIEKKIQLESLKKELRKVEAEIKEINGLIGEGTRRGKALIAESKTVGLLSIHEDPNNFQEVVNLLRSIDSKVELVNVVVPINFIQNLRESRAKVSREYNLVREEIEIAEAFLKDASGFSNESLSQQNRLKSINFFETFQTHDTTCPMCLKDGTDFSEIENDIKISMKKLSSQIDTVMSSKPKISSHLQELSVKRKNMEFELQELTRSLQDAQNKNEELIEKNEFERLKYKTQGRISLYLESVELKNNIGNLSKLKSRLELEIKELSEEISYENQQEILDSQLSIIGKKMTKWAKEFEMEYSGFDHTINLNKLTVQALTSNGPVSMSEMGSAANWLGCHLIAYFSLQSWFVERNRPVPSFIFLDQPSQVWFPPEADNLSENNSGNDDWDSVKKVYSWIGETTKSIDNLQVILVDHVRFKDKKFTSNIVEVWRDGLALVPYEWL